MWLIFRMNGILCAYLRATEPSTPSVEATRVAAALDGELDDVLGIEIDRVRRKRCAGGMLDALIDRQDRQVAGVREPPVAEQRLQAAQHAGLAVVHRHHAVHEIRPRQMQRLLREFPYNDTPANARLHHPIIVRCSS